MGKRKKEKKKRKKERKKERNKERKKEGKKGTGRRAWLNEKSSTAFVLVDLKRQKC